MNALVTAEETLAFVLYGYEADERKIPEASKREDIVLEKGQFVNYIACDTIAYAKKHNNKAVKKTLTVPEWLNEAATKAGVNFSQVLQEALIEKIR